jgi:Flp pilus assembly protein TadG
MKSVVLTSPVFSRIQDFCRDRRGVSAVEFATVLPFMLIAYLGSVEVGNGINAKVRVAETARTVTDLATQYFTIKNAEMTNIFNASSAVMAPFQPVPWS